MADVAFEGFSDETLGFYEGLEADNSKAYWDDHREVFERAVRTPMTALVDALEPEFGPAKLFRPYRDVRFSKDKTPYKTAQGAVVAHPGGAGSWYVRVDATGLLLGGGMFGLTKDQLARFRAAIGADRTGQRFATAVAALTGAGWSTMGDTLIRVPRGFDAEHPRADLLRHKSFALTIDHGDPDWFVTAECLDRVAAGWREVLPVLDWLGEHVGPAEPAE
jgi:uncharacterized protein (TIGR02453 family)